MRWIIHTRDPVAPAKLLVVLRGEWLAWKSSASKYLTEQTAEDLAIAEEHASAAILQASEMAKVLLYDLVHVSLQGQVGGSPIHPDDPCLGRVTIAIDWVKR